MMKYISHISGVLLLLTLSTACEQSEPPNFGRTGDEVNFSGYLWDVKHSESLLGPGPNLFSNHADDIYLDEQGYLHLWINERNGNWYSTEVVSRDTMGYGTYSFTIEGDFVNMPENITVGLFTWDNNTFYEEANSEVDVELSKWGDASKQNTLQYAIQPVAFSTYFAERVESPEGTEPNLIGVSTHVFHWTDSLVTFNSYLGEEAIDSERFAGWTFDLNNPPRVKEEGGQSSRPIVIPAPGNTTNARINYWLQPWVSVGPTDGEPQELIVRSFKYSPN